MTSIKKQSLFEVLGQIEDFRKIRGTHHPLQAILATVCAQTVDIGHVRLDSGKSLTLGA
ncbi:MAG: hypothetical protein HQM14_17280 [SAR324 cluster bacterium]|nr:hypothetical protein [SAR324 cluster bacterium]